MTDEKGNVFLEFWTIQEEEINNNTLDAPLTHALIVVKVQGKYLLMFNKWRKTWELPGGIIEEGETARALVDFVENDEAEKITLWDTFSDIGYIESDRKLIEMVSVIV